MLAPGDGFSTTVRCCRETRKGPCHQQLYSHLPAPPQYTHASSALSETEHSASHFRVVTSTHVARMITYKTPARALS